MNDLIQILESRNARKEIRLESNDTFNRLHSIAEDAAFIRQLAQAYPRFRLYPNLRCGAWYADPDIMSACHGKEPASFKSTDGHFGEWSFNLRQRNLHLLQTISEHGGIILVDSTRHGKCFPDALSKAIPIWCAVINLAIAREYTSEVRWTASDSHENGALYTPPGSVSRSEHSQIELRLDSPLSILSSHQSSIFAQSSEFSLPPLQKPLRPIWITPDTSTLPSLTDIDFFPVLCVSTSKLVHEGLERRTAGFTYVQGSGDDHESWSQKLTPDLYWQHKSLLLSCARSDLSDLIHTLVSESAEASSSIPQ
ncbi:hypothetical protein M422DRAFT_191977 [Sphaerobolus stellatus SS14]|uniref:Rit1 N-terminal domain-containing protein n=1 Tax=Sphaerobolus stellatus (strain SS14) TaxID=990650 RepID=A0A0C9TBU3_SPHS4|nr:hypothetical protein M422DRAFT_191977 [Sphaerobolus stellatus SS14]